MDSPRRDRTAQEGRGGVLLWDKPAKVLSPEEWASISADSAPPGVYVPNMSADDRARWKAKLTGQRRGSLQVEIRKDSTVIVVSLNGGYTYNGYAPGVPGRRSDDINLHIATAGPIRWTWQEYSELQQAIDEARAILEAAQKEVK